ncbi:nuclear transport factor 2 family protein [Cellulomonas sp. McL0617]|uniref:nuclear transport factor 2 family protein n=1 Tax=Cellulomonas sp. McL0617 TaxID=3415675 RepID=UPI003CF795CF
MEDAAFALALRDATNARDVDRVVACFAADYVNETPGHPARGFTGVEQVRRNWTQIFAGVPDHTASLVASAQQGETVWTEWEMSGTRLDGRPHLMRGVIRFTVREGLASAARFYVEPVDQADVDADAAVHRIVG